MHLILVEEKSKGHYYIITKHTSRVVNFQKL